MRCIALLLLIPVAALCATVKLYLKDGTYQLAREYVVQQDRVRFFSTERDDWEEIPVELVDLDRTKREIADRAATVEKETKEDAEEDAALRAAAKEVERVPQESGVYYIHGDQLEPVKVGESKIVNDKRRTTLKILTPVPIINGRQTVELDGENSPLRVADTRPEFYFRLSNDERFGMVKLTKTKKNSRIVEQIDVVPISKELVEHFDEVDTFKKQVGDLLFKIWPEKDLEPGEYALIEYTEGKINLQVWDFGVGQGTPAPKAPEKKKKK
ncbi:MAG TPA: hypothetical protein VKS01_09470 [Bryobacteraceae bacterium]|nr:hypothetical protein [Bryobacteraceae bacterium]